MDNLTNILSSYLSGASYLAPLIIVISFLAGIIASLSPCTLGILPLVIGYVGGYSKEGNKKLFVQLLSFSFGLSFVLSIIGVICALTGRAFTSIASPVLILLFASIILIMGLNLLGILELNFPALVKKMPQNKTGSKFVLPFLVGVFFALASSPCSSPILASIIAIATVSTNILFSVLLLFMFALGQCLIIIFIALFTSTVKHFGVLSKYSLILMKASGILLVLFSIFVFYKIFSSLI